MVTEWGSFQRLEEGNKSSNARTEQSGGAVTFWEEPQPAYIYPGGAVTFWEEPQPESRYPEPQFCFISVFTGGCCYDRIVY
jgi:hypothetical protein